jgi:hypothetical protein
MESLGGGAQSEEVRSLDNALERCHHKPKATGPSSHGLKSNHEPK